MKTRWQFLNEMGLEQPPAPGILQLINDMEKNVFRAIPIADRSWVPENMGAGKGEFLLGKAPVHDGSGLLIEAFIEAVINQKKVPHLVEH